MDLQKLFEKHSDLKSDYFTGQEYIKIPLGVSYNALEKLVKELVSKIPMKLPSHAELTKEALNVLGRNDSEQNIQRHKDYIAGGVWMLDECNNKINTLNKQSN